MKPPIHPDNASAETQENAASPVGSGKTVQELGSRFTLSIRELCEAGVLPEICCDVGLGKEELDLALEYVFQKKD